MKVMANQAQEEREAPHLLEIVKTVKAAASAKPKRHLKVGQWGFKS